MFWPWTVYLENREQIAPLLSPLVSLIGSAATLIVGVFVARAALRQASIARLRHEEQTKADLQRRITETFTKAVEQLGSDKLQVRLGGIYALERVSRESASDYWSVIEILTGFLRERARWQGDENDDGSDTMARLYFQDDLEKTRKRSPATDVAAVLTVIKRRSGAGGRFERENACRMNLSRVDLSGADLRQAYLQGADLSDAHLECADFREAHLEQANFQGAHLQGAVLRAAHLRHADFREAHLEGAVLRRAALQDADLRKAVLEGTNLAYSDLRRANLADARLDGAHLEATDLSTAYGLMQHQMDDAHGDRVTKLPIWITRPSHWSSISSDTKD